MEGRKVVEMRSIWTENTSMPRFDKLKGSRKTDVLIIGGGMAGILCAYFLENAGVEYILAEGRRICSGVTKNTTAKITAQHGLIYHKLLKGAGLEKAKMYLDANQEAVRKFDRLCRSIECDYEVRPSFVYSRKDSKKLEHEAEALARLGARPILTEECELPIKTAGAVGFAEQAQFNPLKFISRIAQGLNIYEETFIRELAEKTALTDEGSIAFDRVIFATHFPIDNTHGMYFMKMYQYRSYVIALKGAPQLKGMYVDEAEGGMSFRSFRDYLLLGGGGHKTGKIGGNWEAIRNCARLYYPNLDERYYWSTQDCITLDGIPYIGRYSRRTQDRYAAAGFNKWGMTASMVSASILTDMILDKENPYAPVFSPSRNMLKPQLMVNCLAAAAHFITFSEKRCPHLGCALVWNRAEHSWDCPCHGSRFDGFGKLLDNPANGDLH